VSSTTVSTDDSSDVSPDAGPLAPRARDELEPTLAPRARARARLFLLLAAVAVWCLPWLGEATGAQRTGAAGALALAGAWGVAAVLLLARTRRDLLLGEAAVSFALAGLVTVLVATGHPWIVGADRRAVLLPVFGPLALLAALDLGTRAAGAAVGVEVAVVRAIVAFLAALAHFVAGDPVPAGAALVLALLPAASAVPRTARGARRALEGVAFVLAVALFLAPELRAAIAPLPASAAAPTVAAFLHRLLGIGLGILAGIGIGAPEPTAGATDLPTAS